MIAKRWASIMAIFLSGWILACLGEPYTDAIEVNDRFVSAMETYLDELEKANTAQEVAGTIDRFAQQLDLLNPAMHEMSRKYPELKTADDLPENVMAAKRRVEAVGKRFVASFAKIRHYAKDPQVKKAQLRLFKIMGQKAPAKE